MARNKFSQIEGQLHFIIEKEKVRVRNWRWEAAPGGTLPLFSGNRFSVFSQPGDPKWLALRRISKLLKCAPLMNPQQNGMNDEV